jgi:L-ribulose-5-phosphate 3-epimerase
VKKSIGNNLIPASMTFEQGLALVRKAGYDGIELWLEKSGYFSLATTDAQVRTLLAQVRDHGLEVSNVSTSLHWETPLSARDPHVRQQAVDIVKRQIELAHMMGTNEILVVPGLVTPEVSYIECYNRCLETLQPLGAGARSAGVTIGLENCNDEQKFLIGPMEFRDLIDKLGAGFGSHLDVGNIHASGYPEQWVEIMGARIARVHIKDTMRKRGYGGGSVYTNIFLGDNDWPAIMRALRKVGYDSYLVAEMEQRYRYCPDQQFYDTSAGLTRLIELT